MPSPSNYRTFNAQEVCAPGDVGMSPGGIQAVRATIQRHIDSGEITGAVAAVMRHQQLVLYEAIGQRDVRAGTAMRTDDLFRMMSSTKPVTAVAVMMLMQDRKLLIDDPVSRFIPSFNNPRVVLAPAGATAASQVSVVPASREITIKDLLTHTSGLSSYGIDSTPGPGALVNTLVRSPGDTLADYVPRLGTSVLDFEPGSQWAYSPFDAFDVLLHIVEIASGQSGDAFLRERIFEPLGMADTYFSLTPASQARLVPLYAREGDSWVVHKPMLDEDPKGYLSGAGGLFSTARDFLQFQSMLLNQGSFDRQQLLKPETVALMAQSHIGALFADVYPPLTGGKGFGLGVAVVEDPARGFGRGRGAFGWGGAYGTESWSDPELGIAAVLLIQRPGAGTVVQAFQQALRDAVVD